MSRALTFSRIATGMAGDTSGNIGIGVTTPGAPLHILSGVQEQLRLGRTTTGSSGYITFFANNASSAQVQYAGILGDVTSSAAGSHSGQLLFYTTNAGASAERVRIDPTGDLLVGATAPKNSGGYDSNRTYLTVQAKTGGVDRGAFLELVGTGGGSPNYWLGRLDFCSTGNPKAHAAIYSFTDSGGANSGALIFGTNASANSVEPTERMRIDSSGVLSLATGQIKFPASQNASSDANTLDDYEEGTWTPTVSASTVSGLTAATHYYTKVGRVVHVCGNFTYTSASAGANYIVLQVPFPHATASGPNFVGVSHAYPNDNNRQAGIVIDNSSGDSLGTYLGFYISPGGSGSVGWSLTYHAS